MASIKPFLMFQGNAEEALNYYASLLDEAKIVSLSRYGPHESGEEGNVMQAVLSLQGQEFICMDSNVKHEFTFTPSFSLFVNCESDQEIEYLYNHLSEGGKKLMALKDYGFSKGFAWIQDKFNVSWQLNLPSD
ncbi:Glyoxalase superfamily enzyme, possibly 3-demethylubiquinone-9 3-methyltransferase [Marinococcus luteus]|uniref:Glyoxalase superfamily enzyme, possibly 3-demethylubiquinone-9 3-methyltransferase n=1 Tax=Marinococcus luteus TaxID=1122204 RepID=A0A1H2XS91_9BACI|nr:VOC family protein [Marinococcus luteus]SDW95802.1 Glyoxalase superfamily enzyme, possibly 3-demethylubiquinone-9 3-methyltransferase [Marinococcus luteus]